MCLVLHGWANRRHSRGRTAVLLALLAGLTTGCLAHQSQPGPVAKPRDPLEVAGLAPAIDADLKAKPSPDPAPRKVVEDGPRARDNAVTPAADPPKLEPDDSPPTTSMPEEFPGVTPRAADTPPPIPVVGQPYPIDLAAALRLADAENPTIAIARVAVLEALAQQMAARAILLPSLNAGGNYHGHEGNLQRSSGKILNLSEQSFYFGGGARTLAAESVAVPAVNIASPLTDAIYEPLAARQRVARSQYQAAATANAVLLEVANLYMELLGAEASLEARRATAKEGDDIAKITRDFALQGEGRPADADRADIERRLLQAEVQRGEEDVALASARLSRRLNLDPSVRLSTLNVPLAPFQLIDASQPSEDLIVAALLQRPDLSARNANIGFAEAKLREELARPFLPTIWLGFSGGVFGGGSNLVPPDLAHFGGRTDFDVRLYWTLLNFGAGNLAAPERPAGRGGRGRGRTSQDDERDPSRGPLGEGQRPGPGATGRDHAGGAHLGREGIRPGPILAEGIALPADRGGQQPPPGQHGPLESDPGHGPGQPGATGPIRRPGIAPARAAGDAAHRAAAGRDPAAVADRRTQRASPGNPDAARPHAGSVRSGRANAGSATEARSLRGEISRDSPISARTSRPAWTRPARACRR